MVDESLITYIKYQLKRGHSKEIIKNALIRAGHNLEIVERHFKAIEEENFKKNNIRYYLVTFLVAILIISIALNFVLYSKKDNRTKYFELVAEAEKLCNEGKYDIAFKNLQKAITLDKTFGAAYGIIGRCYMQQNKSIEAIEALKIAISRSPNEPLHFYRLGVSYCRIGNYNFGIANFLRSIQLNPNNPDFYRDTSKCYAKAGNQAEAQKYFDLYNKLVAKNNTQIM